MPETVRRLPGKGIEFCCRECGEWKRPTLFDAEGTFNPCPCDKCHPHDEGAHASRPAVLSAALLASFRVSSCSGEADLSTQNGSGRAEPVRWRVNLGAPSLLRLRRARSDGGVRPRRG